MLNILFNLIQIQIKEFIRKPIILFWALGFPMLMSMILGFAFSHKPKPKMNIAIFCSEKTSQACSSSKIASDVQTINQFIKKTDSLFQETKGIQLNFYYVSKQDAFNMLGKNMTSLVLEYHPTTDLQTYHFDPKNDESNKAYIIVKHFFDIKSTIKMLEKDPKNKDSIIIHNVKRISSVGFRFIDFLIPGLLAMSIMHSSLWGIGWPFIELRSKKLLKRMLASPLSKSMLVLSYFCTRLIITSIECFSVFIFGKFLFGIQVQGSFISFIILFISAVFCFSGLGILIGSRTSIPRVGSGLIELFTIPMILFSGIFFHYSNFPESWIPFLQYIPLAITVDTIRDIFITGVSLSEIIIPSSILVSIGLSSFLVGIKIFKWT